MKSDNLLSQLNILPHFDKNTVFRLGGQMGLKDASVNTYISRFLRRKEIIQLKRGVYTSSDFYNNNKDDFSYSFYLANIIRSPSYVSSWAALQHYNLATESIRSVTSVTTKITRNYQTKAGNFSYNSIKNELFSDFYLAKGKFDFFIASPSKALFDLLYFKTKQFRGVSRKAILPMIEELRIDFGEMDKKEREKFNYSIKKYINE